MKNKLNYYKSIAFSLILLQTCKTFELKDEARNIIFTKDIRIETSNLCNQITFLIADDNANNEDEKINDLKNQAYSLGGNFILADFLKIQRPTSNGKLETIPAFGVYNCNNPTNFIASLDSKEKEDILKEKKQEEFRLDKNPHNWVICESMKISRIPNQLTQSMLNQMKPKAYDSKTECDKTASIENQIGREFGFQCTCQFTILNK
ncbi:MAG: hypothetical protein O9275_20665 [Microcystis sp. LE19-196.1B]|nr:hypothetical protein [Microcystis sp. LE19-196.1B]